MTTIIIEKPHGYLLDSDGKVIDRFGNWATGPRMVYDATDRVEYVDGPSAHNKTVHADYQPEF